MLSPDHVLDRAISIADESRDNGITRGRSLHATAAGALNVACRMEGVPRTLSDITDTLDARNKPASMASNRIITTLGLRIEPPEASSHIPRIVSKVGADETVGRNAREMFAEFKARHLDMGRKPSSFAATVVYLASKKVGKSITQDDVADAAGVTTVSIRNTTRMLNAKMSAAS